VNLEGVFVFSSIGDGIKPLAGTINLDTGELGLEWSEPPGQNYAVVGYEYNMGKSTNPHDSNSSEPTDEELNEMFTLMTEYGMTYTEVRSMSSRVRNWFILKLQTMD
jgi:hypothetical protein